MEENNFVIVANGAEIATLALAEINNSPTAKEWVGEYSEAFLEAGIVGYYGGKVVVHSEEVTCAD